MPRTHLLDTSVYSQAIKRTPNRAALRRWDELGDERVAIAAICHAEIRFGILKSGAPSLLADYETNLRDRLPVLSVDQAVAEAYAVLRRDCEALGNTVGDMDLLIAATAQVNGLTVATLNTNDFAHIPGLAVEDWSR